MKLWNKIFIGAAISAAALAASVTGAQAKDGAGNIVIIVDPGHGGNDGGSASSYDNEATLNWNIATALKAELQTYNGSGYTLPEARLNGIPTLQEDVWDSSSAPICSCRFIITAEAMHLPMAYRYTERSIPRTKTQSKICVQVLLRM